MPSNLKFPPTVEIKRVIAAAARAGIEIASVDIHPKGITIHTRDPAPDSPPALNAYDLWKLSERENSAAVRHEVEKSAALRVKSKR